MASVVVFAVLDVLPGNVAQVMLGESATPQAVAALEKKLGLDRPALERYSTWVQGLLTLGFAVELERPEPVLKDLLFAAKGLGLELEYRKLAPGQGELPRQRYALTVIARSCDPTGLLRHSTSGFVTGVAFSPLPWNTIV